MSLRLKTLVILLAVLVALIAVLLLTAQTVLLSSLEDLERQAILRDLERVQNGLANELARISASNQDYARWDDTYAFIQSPSPEYIDANMADSALVNLAINVFVFLDSEGEVVFAKAVDLQAEQERPLPGGLLAALTPDSPLVGLDAQAAPQGVLLTDDGPALVTARPIQDSLAAQPPRGSLVFTVLLDEARLQQLSEALRLPIVAQPLGLADLPDEFRGAQAALAEQATYVRNLPDDRIAAYAILNDLNGQPALMLRVDGPRSVYAQGLAAINLFTALMAFAGVVFGGVSLLVLERTILARLTRLSDGVNRITTSGDITQRVPTAGDDELARLGHDINGMLQVLEHTQNLARENDVRLRTIVNGVPIILWMVDRDGNLTLLEGKSLELLGLDPRGVGQPASEVFRNIPQMLEQIQRALRGDEFSAVLPIKEFTFDSRCIPMRGTSGAITGMVGVATDITERMMAEEALGAAHEALAQRSQQLERVQGLLHTTLEQLAAAVERGASPDEIRQLVAFIRSQAERPG